ncbi:MAG: hypothetical protein JOZ02_06450 [Acidobacteria bacterium]|nr:hypothetical protein [Acidobacteriota bacterium]
MGSKNFKAAPARGRRDTSRRSLTLLGLLALLPALASTALFHASRARAQVRPQAVKLKPQAPVRPIESDEVTTEPVNTRPVTIKKLRPRAPVQTKPQAPVLTDAPPAVTTTRIQPVSVTKVNFKQLADLAKRARLSPQAAAGRTAPIPGSIIDTPPGLHPDAAGGPAPTSSQDDAGGPLVASPSPSQSFLAQEDGPKLDGPSAGFSFIPPDTNGAVGLDRVFTNTNSNFRVHDKATGAPLSTVSSDTFWASSGGGGFFDPQIQFDPYSQRWILAIVSNAQTANSSISVAVSQTSDPAGGYNVFRFVVGCASGETGCASGGEWADYPMLGFNKNWIAVGVNMFNFAANVNNNDKVLVLDYPSARAGAAVATIVSGTGIGFCDYPVTTYSATEETLYLIKHGSSGDATYRVSTITGTPAAPSLTVPDTFQTRPGGGWAQPGGDFLPQQCVPGVGAPTQVCPASPRAIDVSDSQVRSSPAFRNGKIYYAQTVGLPAGGMTHTAAQWTVLDAATGNFLDGGRVEDAAATVTNGGRHYAYPSLSVNKNGDVLMGFSEFESDDYADAGYSFRLGTDAPGTMRDPVIYKEGEDYYEKTFGAARNRWGDYSHTVIDPFNDRDLWTVQEYAGTRVGVTGTGSNESRWGTWWAKVTAPAVAGDLLISEFRLFGPNGPAPAVPGGPAPEPNEDEFVELYNNNDTPLTVAAADGSAGYSVAASDGVIRCTIPNGTVIPARGHFLCANSDGYSLGGSPAGAGTTATPDATYTDNIRNNSGIALFNTANTANYSATTRLDAAGPTSEANALYKEGSGYAPLTQYLIDYSLYRDTCGKGGSVTALGACPTGGLPRDTDDNATDFLFVDTNATPAGAGQRLGAPGPENLSSPVQRNGQVAVGNLDPAVGTSSPPNRVRTFAEDGANNSTFGTLLIRRTITNNTGAPVTRLRFRVVDQTTYPAPPGSADLRARTSGATPIVVTITGTNPACTGRACTVQQTTLETPPAQPNGGGLNATLSAGSVTLANPVPAGGQINVQFLLGIQQTGTFKFFFNVEALP